MKPMNDLLADIVTASGGTVTSYTRNGLLRDWLDAVSGNQSFLLNEIVTIGASITNHSTNEFTTQFLVPYIKNSYGIDIRITDLAVSGSDVADLKANIDSYLAPYAGLTGIVFAMHIGGGDISPSVQFLDTGASEQSQKIADLEYIYDAIHAAGHKVIQAALTFRNYDGTTIDNDPDVKSNELLGSYTYTRDWIVPVMQSKAPEFVANGWPILDQYNVTRNVYKDWRGEDDLTDYIHPSELGKLHFSLNMVDSIVRLSQGLSVKSVTPIDYNIPSADGSAIDVVVGFGRDTVIGSTNDNINWVSRVRPPVVGTEPVYISSVVDTNGSIVDGVEVFSYVSRTYRNGEGNTADPTNNTASLLNNTLLSSGLGMQVGNGVMYVLITGLSPLSRYNIQLAAGLETGATDYTNRILCDYRDNVPLVYNASASPATSNMVEKNVYSDFNGRVIIAICEDSASNYAAISGMRIHSL